MTKQKAAVLGSFIGIPVGIIVGYAIFICRIMSETEYSVPLSKCLIYAVFSCFIVGGMVGEYIGSDTKKE